MNLSRRAALRRVSLGASAVALSSVFQISAADGRGARKALWKTAIGLNGFASGESKHRKRYPLWDILDFAAREGFDGIELVADWPQGGYPRAAEKDRIAALKRLYDAYGLRIFSIQLMAEGAFGPDGAARGRWLEEFRDRVGFARAAGCAHVGLWPGGGLRGQTIDAAIERLSESFREANKIAADAGLVAAFEIEPPFVFNSTQHLLRIREQSGMKAIYDPSHFDLFSGSRGAPHEVLQQIGVANIGYVHFTDTDGTLRDGGTSKHLAAGDGHAQLTESLRILREGGYRGWIMVDSWEVPDPYDACSKAARMIKTAAV